MADDAPLLDVDAGAPSVILSPHLDDAVWSTFSLLAGDEPDVIVVTVFAGIPEGKVGWWDAECGITDSAEHVLARRREDSGVLASLGRSAIHLDLLDDQYRESPTDPADVVASLASAVSTVSRIYAPSGIGHPDHAIVRDAAVLIARSGVPTTLYTDYCYCTREGWPTWVAANGRTEADAQWRDAIGDIVGERISSPRVRRLDDGESLRKLEAMRGYVTQYDNIEREEPRWQHNGKPPSDPEMRVIEVFYDLPAS